MTDAREWLANAQVVRVETGALLAVLDLHVEGDRLVRDDTGATVAVICAECGHHLPCPTVRAIEKALGVGDG